MTRPPYVYPDPDRDYMNAAFIPGAQALLDACPLRAAAFRDSLGARAELDIAYGPGPRNGFDLFRPEGDSKGVLIFVHGGFWLGTDRKTWSHYAAGAVARGWTVAMPSYTLAPEARVSQMTQEVLAACLAVQARVPGRMTVAGHSAGGHLAARMAVLDSPAAAVMPISPLAELGPLMGTKMNLTLQIDAAEAEAESPARQRPRPGVACHIWTGAAERPAFMWQSRSLSEEWGCPETLDANRHHYDVLEPLCTPQSAMVELLLGL